MTNRHSTLPSMLMALAAFALFATGDAMVRSTAGAWPGTAFALLRYAAGLAGLGLFVAFKQGKAGFAIVSPGIQLARGTVLALGGTMFWVSLSYMPLADATAIQFTNPAWAALLSAIFLREKIGGRQVFFVALAFAGVLIVLQPNVAAFGPAALLPLGSGLGMAILVILNRSLGARGTVLGNQFWLAFFATATLIPVTILGHVSPIARLEVGPPSIAVIAKALFVAVTGTFGHLLLYKATLRASAASIAPMTYVQILFAVVIGWLVFASPPKPSMLLGSLVIIAAGWFLIRANIRMARALAETGVAAD